MEIQARRVGVNGAQGPLLPPTSLAARSGAVTLVSGEPGQGHTALALAVAGRMRPSSGTVLLDGAQAPERLRRRVAVVDAPGVSAPEDALDLAFVVREEMGLGGHRASRRRVATWLAERDAGEYAHRRFDSVPPELRLRLLVELAAIRRGVRGLVLDCPDRHGCDPELWWSLARAQAEQGMAVVVLCAPPTAALLDVPAARLGEHDQPPPVVVQEPEPAEVGDGPEPSDPSADEREPDASEAPPASTRDGSTTPPAPDTDDAPSPAPSVTDTKPLERKQ
ncbi:ABC transporter ATP-binding protein [Longimycelium tulufanense]|uniref:ABC transporter ATP-binding protein n=1 Tax=Longimycelium tulufanense TaxID=907463 RepID=A0A8J3FVR7_9PSEU|nr:ATP-binding cassette domain-containing protein [Longimycelium tulufanense]GGM70972.1 ABC transporter ATP-binding protein [Longimycelium tulufanense]